jgi:hypothetical protein
MASATAPKPTASRTVSESEWQDFQKFQQDLLKKPLEQQIKNLQETIKLGGPASQWVQKYLYQLFLYLPNALVLFGPIIDTINQELRYSLASIIGLCSIFVNWIFGKIMSIFLKSYSSVVAQRCTVPGFESLESFFSPQGVVLPASIFTYLLIDLGIHRPSSQNIGTGVLMVVFILIQAFVMSKNGCFAPNVYYFGTIGSVLIAVLVGAFCGTMGWVGVRFTAPSKLPSSAGSISPSSVTQKAVNPLGSKSGTPDVGTCSPPNDQDQFVCEAYKDGEVVTSTIVS